MTTDVTLANKEDSEGVSTYIPTREKRQWGTASGLCLRMFCGPILMGWADCDL